MSDLAQLNFMLQKDIHYKRYKAIISQFDIIAM